MNKPRVSDTDIHNILGHLHNVEGAPSPPFGGDINAIIGNLAEDLLYARKELAAMQDAVREYKDHCDILSVPNSHKWDGFNMIDYIEINNRLRDAVFALLDKQSKDGE